MKKTVVFALALTALALDLYAVETKFWQQADQSDFDKGSFDNIALRSDGRMSLAPAAHEVFESSIPYLWTAASDSKGNLYAAGGGSGNGRSKLFEISRDAKSKTIVELDGLEIHAIAIDKNDQIYAATDPDGKIYKVSRDGKSQMYYDPQAKYIWAMAFDQSDNLYVATGDQGQIHRVAPGGKGSVFFRTEETHARSLAVDSSGNLIVGTEPGGLILRISPDARGFVLYQAPKKEITAVAVASNGAIYASGVGNRIPSTPLTTSPSTPGVTTPPPASASSPATAQVVIGRPTGSSPSFTPATVTGGSDVYRIDADGSPHKIWSHLQDIVYAIAFDSSGLPLFGTGNRGRVYRLDSDVLSTQLLSLAPTQVTSFATSRDGRLFAVTGNVGKIYQIGPAFSKTGTFESDVLDAGSFAYWGRLAVRGSGSGVSLRTRSGNLNRPVNNWSQWSPVPLQAQGRDMTGRISSPPARFIQYQVTMNERGAEPPGVASVEIAYLTKNVAPVIQEIETTPANYKFPTQTLTLTPSTNITLPPLGQKRSTSTTVPTLDIGTSQSLSYSKGFIGARWLAHDENGDSLIYRLEIRGRGEAEWKLLKDKLKEKEYSWDSTAFPDGEYELRVTASDAPSNPPAEALTATLVSDPFLIDNTPPELTGFTASMNGGRMRIQWRAHDARNIIDHAEYSLNGGDWTRVEPTSHLSDSPDEEYSVVIDRPNSGEQTIAVRVTDAYDNQTVAKTVLK